MDPVENYRSSMPEAVLHDWAQDAQKEMEALRARCEAQSAQWVDAELLHLADESSIYQLRQRIAEMEGSTDKWHRLGMLHACALLSLTVHDSDGNPLDQIQLLTWCDDARESFGLNGK